MIAEIIRLIPQLPPTSLNNNRIAKRLKGIQIQLFFIKYRILRVAACSPNKRDGPGELMKKLHQLWSEKWYNYYEKQYGDSSKK